MGGKDNRVILMTQEELEEFVDSRVHDALIKAQFRRAEYSMLTEAQVKDILKLSTTSLWRLRKQNKFPEPIRLGRTNMYRMTDLMSVLNNPSR